MKPKIHYYGRGGSRLCADIANGQRTILPNEVTCPACLGRMAYRGAKRVTDTLEDAAKKTYIGRLREQYVSALRDWLHGQEWKGYLELILKPEIKTAENELGAMRAALAHYENLAVVYPPLEERQKPEPQNT